MCIDAGRRSLHGRRIHLAREHLAIAASAAVAIDAEVPADANQPGLKVRAAIERAERSKDLEENLLREVFRFFVRTDEPVRDVEDLSPVRRDDRFPRGLIALGRALDGHINGHRLMNDIPLTVM